MHNGSMANWSDLKFLLQVARDGSTLAASRSLATNQTTVMRRITALEGELGLTLFERRRSGYVPTDALKALMPQLEAIEIAHVDFEKAAATLVRGVSGTIRLTAPELLVVPLLAPALTALREQHPAIRIELVTTDGFLDLDRGEADIALRASDPPTSGSLLGRRINGADGWSVCCSKGYAATHGAPRTAEGLASHPLVGVIESHYKNPMMEWLDSHIHREGLALRQSSLTAIYAAVRSGFGVSIAPDIVLAADPDMVRCFPVGIDPGKQLWLLTHERHRHTAHVRTALDFLGGLISNLVKSRLKTFDQS
jgi:DNA-binding transcriptional LysR family regulator